MNRPIKFRGRDVVTKRFVYGFYCKCGDTGLSKILTFKKGIQGFFPVVVAPDTVAQLVGYDKNGKEVYEDDVLIDANGHKYVACIQSMVYIPDKARTMPFDFVGNVTSLTLKEQVA